MRSTKIYLITDIEEFDKYKVYIGKSCRLEKREKEHRARFGNQIILTVIDEIESLSRKDWKPLECFWIEQFEQWGFKLINKNKGGGGPAYHSAEIRAKMGRKGIKKPGVSKALKGRIWTEEEKQKLRKPKKLNYPRYREPRSEETRQKLREIGLKREATKRLSKLT
jgi:hypothetical protein